MAVRRHGAGWQVRVRPFPEVTLPTREAADTVELELKLRKKLGHLYVEKPTSFGFELDARFDRKVAMGGRRGKLRPATERFYRQNVQPWGPLRETLIPNLRRSLMEDHIAARAAVAPTAARNELQFAKASLSDAKSRGQQVDPGIFAIAPIRVEPREGVALELATLDVIAAALPERIRRIVPFVGTVGLRFTEAVTLDDEHVDLDNATIYVPRDLNKARRFKAVPLARFEVQLLREQLMVRTPGASVVFASTRGTRYSESGLRKVWLPGLKAAGLTHEETGEDGRPVTVPDFRFHWLRHTAISLMARSGMKPELIAERVGHSDGGALVLSRYRHLFPSEVRAAVEQLDRFVAAGSVGRMEARDG